MYSGYFKIKIIKSHCKLSMQVLEMDEALRSKDVIFKNKNFEIASVGVPDLATNILFLRGGMEHMDDNIVNRFFGSNRGRDLYLNKLSQCIADYKESLRHAG